MILPSPGPGHLSRRAAEAMSGIDGHFSHAVARPSYVAWNNQYQ